MDASQLHNRHHAAYRPSSPTSARPSSPPATAGRGDGSISAYCYIAEPRGRISASIARIVETVKAGETRILIGHICRTSEELPVGVALLELAEQDYPEAILGALGLATELDGCWQTDANQSSLIGLHV